MLQVISGALFIRPKPAESPIDELYFIQVHPRTTGVYVYSNPGTQGDISRTYDNCNMTTNKLKITSLVDDTVELNWKVIKYIANHFLSCPEGSKKRPALVINNRLYNRASIGRAGKNIVSILACDYSNYDKRILLTTSNISRIKPTLGEASGDKGIIMDINGKKSIVKLVYIV